jgi:hypothetical protein
MHNRPNLSDPQDVIISHEKYILESIKAGLSSNDLASPIGRGAEGEVYHMKIPNPDTEEPFDFAVKVKNDRVRKDNVISRFSASGIS